MIFERVHNFRAVAGFRTDDGRPIQPGRLYRSDSLAKFDDADWQRFLDLGIRTVIDLRYPWEIARTGRIREHPSLRYHNLSIEHRPYNQATLGPDIEPASYLAVRFAEVAADGVVELRAALEVIADPAAAPVVVHCASGKDRTGIVVALVLALLGVSEHDIVADFTRTEQARDRLIEDWRAGHPGRPLTWPGYGRAPAELITRFLADLAAAHGSVEGYARNALGVDDQLRSALRRQLVDDRLWP